MARLSATTGEQRIVVNVSYSDPATTDEERAARARWNDLRRKAVSVLRGQTFESLTEAEETEYHELSTRYHFLGDAIKHLKAIVEKNRAEGEERSRLRQLERQKKAAAVARISSQRE
jgi:hypothetical protein